MKTLQESFIDKSKWPVGPWQTEPDKKQWATKSGYPGLIVRGPLGALCGYVGVSDGHPSFKKDYQDVDVDVHGGLTYDGFCTGKICHEVLPGENDWVWWLGFDCAHLYDLSPASSIDYADEEYRDFSYVEREVESLASQLKHIAKAGR